MVIPCFHPWRSWQQAILPGAAVIPRLLVALVTLMLLNGWRQAGPPTTSPPTANAVLEAFTQKSGITGKYPPCQSPEEAEDNLRPGNRYVLIENQLFPALIKEPSLAALDLAPPPHFKNFSANFRDLVIDPGNRSTVPASYGTTGLVVRTDLVGDNLKRRADLWSSRRYVIIG